MTELSVILGLNLAAVALVSALLKWLFEQDDTPGDARGLATAMRGATSAFRSRQAKRSLLVLLGVTLLSIVCAHQVSTLPGAAVHMGVGCALGGLLAGFVGQLVSGLGPRAARATASGLGGASSSLLVLALRGAASLALATELAVSLTVVAVMGACFTIYGNATPTWLPAARLVLTGIAVGALAVHAVTHFSGSAVSGAGEAGRYYLDQATPTRFRLEAKSPAMVVSAIGPELGPLATSTYDLLSLSVLCHLGPLVIVLATADPGGAGALTLVSACLLVRACGLLACGVALWSLRVDDPDDPVLVVFRGQLAASAMAGFATVGACRWLWPDGSFSGAVGMGLLGVLGHALLAFVTWAWVQRGSRALTWVREAALGSAASASGLGVGLSSLMAITVLAALVAILGVCAALAGNLEVPGGALFSLALCLSGFTTSLAFSLTLAGGEPVLEGACGLASVGRDGSRPQGVSRLGTLDFVAPALGSMGHIQALGAWSLLGVGVLFLSFRSATWEPFTTLPVVSALIGMSFVLALVGLSLSQIARTVSASAVETQRQLRAVSRELRPGGDLPVDFSPSYRDQLDRVAQVALSGTYAPAAACVSFPLVVGIVGAEWLDASQLNLAVAWFLAATLVVASSLGALGTLVTFVLKGAHRHSRASSTAHQLALNGADLFAHLTGSPLALASRLALAGATTAGLVLVGVIH